eukprot:COSAG06_NODE_1090_length_10746_cov_5.415892_10_plen_210_part_00
MVHSAVCPKILTAQDASSGGFAAARRPLVGPAARTPPQHLSAMLKLFLSLTLALALATVRASWSVPLACTIPFHLLADQKLVRAANAPASLPSAQAAAGQRHSHACPYTSPAELLAALPSIGCDVSSGLCVRSHLPKFWFDLSIIPIGLCVLACCTGYPSTSLCPRLTATACYCLCSRTRPVLRRLCPCCASAGPFHAMQPAPKLSCPH